MNKRPRPIVFDGNGVAVCRDDGQEEARYNPKRDPSIDSAVDAAKQSLARGDIEKPRYIAFITALQANAGLEMDARERQAFDQDLTELTEQGAVGYVVRAEEELDGKAKTDRAAAYLDRFVELSREGISNYDSIRKSLAA